MYDLCLTRTTGQIQPVYEHLVLLLNPPPSDLIELTPLSPTYLPTVSAASPVGPCVNFPLNNTASPAGADGLYLLTNVSFRTARPSP